MSAISAGWSTSSPPSRACRRRPSGTRTSSTRVGRPRPLSSTTSADNGRGLPPEGRDRLAEPYVTTRSKGTGLGLAIVKKIMEDHGGELILDDREGGGARVMLIFHRAETRDSAPPAEALPAIRSRQPSLVVLDIWLQGSELDGLEILKIVRRELPSLPVVMISGHGNIETAVAAIKIGAYDFIEKPFKSDRLLLVVERAIEAARLKREVEELRLRAGGDEELIGVSHAMGQLRQQVERVAGTGSRVLVSGPPGAGKDVVARVLHIQSR